MESQQIKLIVEGALLAAGRALSLQELGNLFDPNGRPSNVQFREVLEQISEDCAERAFELREVGSGFRFQVRQEFGTWVSRLWEEKPARYSRALLETLALVAYRQPITRAEIEEVRGVAVSTNIIKTLLERSWVKVVGHRDTPGKPALYAADVFATIAGSQGIRLKAAKVVNKLPTGTLLLTHNSEPLRKILRQMLKYSTNL